MGGGRREDRSGSSYSFFFFFFTLVVVFAQNCICISFHSDKNCIWRPCMPGQTHTSAPCSFSHNLKSPCWKLQAQLLWCQQRESSSLHLWVYAKACKKEQSPGMLLPLYLGSWKISLMLPLCRTFLRVKQEYLHFPASLPLSWSTQTPVRCNNRQIYIGV